MSRSKPTSRFIIVVLTLILTLLLHFPTPIKSSEPQNLTADETEDGELEELLALDQQVEQEEDQDGAPTTRSLEAELLSNAQRIVLELNHDNTKRVIENNEFVLVLGYAPWCSRSAELMPQFAEAATALKELGSPLLMPSGTRKLPRLWRSKGSLLCFCLSMAPPKRTLVDFLRKK